MSEKIFNPLEHPVCMEFPLWLEETAWAGHVPFAMFLVSAAKPRALVELGAFRGVSYCAFCQAVAAAKTNTKCYAVDTWQGDAQAGELEASVLRKLKTHHDPLYADFSRLIQATFDEAITHFADGSIDLLHIDGFHTYEAVSHDFETWKPKMSERGIILFHDINVRERDFGVWKFWEEAKREFPHFEFLHSHGLGVLAVGAEISENIKFLFEAGEDESVLIRQFFHALGERIETVVERQKENWYILELEKYRKFVKSSRFLRAFRVWKDEGAKSFIEKGSKKLKSDE